MGREGLAKRETFSAASAVHWKSERTFLPFRRKLGKKRKEGPAHFFLCSRKRGRIKERNRITDTADEGKKYIGPN